MSQHMNTLGTLAKQTTTLWKQICRNNLRHNSWKKIFLWAGSLFCDNCQLHPRQSRLLFISLKKWMLDMGWPSVYIEFSDGALLGIFSHSSQTRPARDGPCKLIQPDCPVERRQIKLCPDVIAKWEWWQSDFFCIFKAAPKKGSCELFPPPFKSDLRQIPQGYSKATLTWQCGQYWLVQNIYFRSVLAIFLFPRRGLLTLTPKSRLANSFNFYSAKMAWIHTKEGGSTEAHDLTPTHWDDFN